MPALPGLPLAATPSRPRRSNIGFTLVELLAAMAVLGVLILIIAQVTIATSNTTRLSNRAVDAAAQARLAFDRLHLDFGALVKRTDTDFLAQNAPAGPTDLLMFLASVASPGISMDANRSISLLAYRVDTHSDNQGFLCLLRAGKPVPVNPSWASPASIMGLTSVGTPIGFTDAAFPSGLLPTAGDYDVLAPGVIRMVVGFQLYPDNQAVPFESSASTPPIANARGQIVYDPPARAAVPQPENAYADLRRISALVVGVVAIDLDSLKLLTPAQVATLASAFPVPSVDQLPVERWTPAANDLITSASTIPLPARQAVRLYQRFFPVVPYGTRGE